ncbi:hypothetical protein WA026_016036 [Henosepilachna vigintioctopunctata]|uniref:Uncharacterized protein n=1 Tax=Henosepilachna vigintioctopunctata TaxID=420089 RepID=A0AAW1U2A4_9CUCU
MLVQLCIIFCVAVVHGSPSRDRNDYNSPKVLYDQKQEGSWNVHASLKDFLFIIIPSVRASNSSGPSSSALEQSLLYMLSKSANSQRRHSEKPKTDASAEEETKHFIESKSAPYQVDISKSSGGLLSRLYPENPESDGVLVAKSPSISLLKDPISGRVARALVFNVPEEDIVITKTEKKAWKKKARGDHIKKTSDSKTDCEPGQVKDSYGNCKVLKY